MNTKKYFVQTRNPDGSVDLSVNTAEQIQQMVSNAPKTGCEFAVYSSGRFCKVSKLVHWKFDDNKRHVFYNLENEEKEFEFTI